MIPVLLYSHQDEPITKALLKPSFIQKHNVVPLSLDRLLNEVCIFDEFDSHSINIEWTIGNHLKITNSEHFFLINRVLSVPTKLVNEFINDDKNYSINEFRSYLAFAIEAFPFSSAKPGPFGLSGNRYSLPRQWHIVKQASISINIPEFFLGNLKYCQLKNDLVYTQPFQYYYWKPNAHVVNSTDFSFVFSKPQGRPLVCTVMGNETEFFWGQGNDNVPTNIINRLHKCALLISDVFNFSVCEILFFVENDKFTFGMISNDPYASSKKSWFESNLQTYFEGMF